MRMSGAKVEGKNVYVPGRAVGCSRGSRRARLCSRRVCVYAITILSVFVGFGGEIGRGERGLGWGRNAKSSYKVARERERELDLK